MSIVSPKSAEPGPVLADTDKTASVPDGRVFYSDDRGVRVTNTKVVVGAETFAFKSVASVRVRAARLQAYGRIGTVVAGALLVLVGFFTGSETGLAVLSTLGIACVTIAILWMVASKTLYVVCVVSPTGTTTVLQSSDKSYVQAVAKAIGEAMVGWA